MWVRIFSCLRPRERFTVMDMFYEFQDAAALTLTEGEMNCFEVENKNVETEMNRGFQCNHLAESPRYVLELFKYN